MATPTVSSVTATNDANTAGPRATMPATVNAGDLLICFAMCSTREDGAAVPSGWTQVKHDNFGNSWSSFVMYKIAAGNEGGTTATGAGGSASFWSSLTFRITGWEGASVDFNNTAFSDATTVNPTVMTASWGSDTNLFIECLFTKGVLAGFSTSYVDTGVSANGHGSSVYAATRALTASSDDPDSMSVTTTQNNFANMAVVRPSAAPSVLNRRSRTSLGTRMGSRQAA